MTKITPSAEYTYRKLHRRGCFVYYEFYADQFFLEHFLTDCILLSLSALVMDQAFHLRRIALGGATGAFLMTACVCIGWPYLWPLCMLSALIGVAGIQHRPLRWWGAQFFTLIFVTFCFGGVLEALNEWYGLPVLAGTAAAAGILYQGFRRRSRQNRRADSQACVSVTVGATTVQMTGLVDTGNQLTEPLTGRAVSILSPGQAEKLLTAGWETERGMCLIPYHSIGKSGWMKAVIADRMETVYGGKTVVTEHPVLAVSAATLSLKAAYGIILHPEHAGGR